MNADKIANGLTAATLETNWKIILDAEERHNPLNLRMRRALSWLDRAEQEQERDGPDAAFIFYWIAFNTIYADHQPSRRRARPGLYRLEPQCDQRGPGLVQCDGVHRVSADGAGHTRRSYSVEGAPRVAAATGAPPALISAMTPAATAALMSKATAVRLKWPHGRVEWEDRELCAPESYNPRTGVYGR